jgi:hypothetical protein
MQITRRWLCKLTWRIYAVLEFCGTPNVSAKLSFKIYFELCGVDLLMWSLHEVVLGCRLCMYAVLLLSSYTSASILRVFRRS